MDILSRTHALLSEMGVPLARYTNGDLAAVSPVDGSTIAQVPTITAGAAKETIAATSYTFEKWRSIPPPQRGELIRLLGAELREHKESLGELVSVEVGKIASEGLGEVQEMIDICDFAVGLSRQLYGLTIATERPGHRMMETWHPAGPVGVISAFNFPVAVWAWNAALAIVCGNPVIWKPSEKAPLTALACEALFDKAVARYENAPDNLLTLLIGHSDIGEILVDSPGVSVISATGSTRMGRIVAQRVASRFGKAVLELGGNNACIICPSANIEMAVSAVAFGAMGTAGQRCTSTRRLFVHESIYETIVPKLRNAYKSVSIGSPLSTEALVGPLIDKDAFDSMQKALKSASALGGIVTGGEREFTESDDAYYVRPALVEMSEQKGIVLEETFAPILYVMKYDDFDKAIALQNAVDAGLSSSIFTTDIREAEIFLSAAGSDCGIANVNIGTSGAEIGGAFGGEKETGGGRESGSDAWKNYMRRATNTINYSRDLPLAQGVSFDINAG